MTSFQAAATVEKPHQLPARISPTFLATKPARTTNALDPKWLKEEDLNGEKLRVIGVYGDQVYVSDSIVDGRGISRSKVSGWLPKRFVEVLPR